MPAQFAYFPFSSGDGSASSEQRWSYMMRWMRTTGILVLPYNLGPLNPSTYDLAVTANATLGVQVAPGKAWIQGFYFAQWSDYFAVGVQPNVSGEDRIDLLTLQLDLVNNVISYFVVEGTPAVSPVVPAPEQTLDLWQMPLASIYVANGASTILSGDITDLRVISVQGSGDAGVTLASAGGTFDLVAVGTGPNLEIDGLSAGTGITLTSSAGNVTISSTGGDDITLESSGGAQSLVVVTAGPNLEILGLTPGTNVSFVEDAGGLTINAAGGGSDVTLSSAGGADSLVADGVGPDLSILGLTPGTGVSFTVTADDITIAATGSEVTLTSAGGITLVDDGTGPSLEIFGLAATTGISLTTNSTTVIIGAPGTNVTLASAGGTTLVENGTGPSLEIYGLSAGTGITLTTSVSAITISASGSPLASTNVCSVTQTGGQSWASGASAAITWDTTVYDPTSMHNTVTNNTRIKALVAGAYLITSAVTVAPATCTMYFLLNGTTKILDGIYAGLMNPSLVYHLNVNDYVECWLINNAPSATSALSIISGQIPVFSMALF